MGLWKSVANLLSKSGHLVTGTLKGGGTALKTAAVGSGAGYVAWETLVNDKPIAKTASSLIIGEENTEKLGGTVDSTISTVNTAAEAVSSMANSANNALGSVANALSGSAAEGQENASGVGNFLSGLMSGNGLGMIGDFFRNIGEGKVSGMSFAGLIGAAFLIFGRFGWLGKIFGALLGMTILGNNLNMSRVMGSSEQPAVARAETPATDMMQQGQDVPVMRRGR